MKLQVLDERVLPHEVLCAAATRKLSSLLSAFTTVHSVYELDVLLQCRWMRKGLFAMRAHLIAHAPMNALVHCEIAPFLEATPTPIKRAFVGFVVRVRVFAVRLAVYKPLTAA